MNKQEFIKKIQELREDGEHDLRTVIYFAEQLDEPSREECDYFTAPYNYGESTDIDYNICNICNYHEQYNDKVKSNFDIWNYCPNCGAKIKRGEER